jgi:hypothetical protein
MGSVYGDNGGVMNRTKHWRHDKAYFLQIEFIAKHRVWEVTDAQGNFLAEYDGDDYSLAYICALHGVTL